MSGLAYGIGAFALWGLSPLYWRLLAGVPAGEILLHRVVWSALLLALFMRGRVDALRRAAGSVRGALALAGTAALIGFNWYLNIWAIEQRRLLDASLGYYINPLLSVIMGALFLRERLRRPQLLAFVLAAAGVAVIVRAHGHLPLLALSLAFSFALYGLLRKLSPVEALTGLAAETFLLALPAAAALALRDGGHFGPSEPRLSLLLIGGAAVTAVPLLWFIEAARRLDLKTVGFLQFLSPSIQFALAVTLFREPLSPSMLAAFALIWAAVALYAFDAAVLTGSPRK